jgi:glycosyltransferase involved in cell wall biosynthesis
MTATVIIATTGVPELIDTVKSVLNQTYDTECYVVVDGPEHNYVVKNLLKYIQNHPNYKKIHFCNLPVNVGANGFYGHRVYAAFTHLINTKYVMYLDHDNILEENHIETCVKKIEENNLDWCYSLRKIIDKEGNYICNDDCESLGKWQTYHGVNMIDTNCYCFKTETAIKLAQVWHGGWGTDRVVLGAFSNYFPKFDCTGQYTVNYRVGGNAGSVNGDFFINGNKVMNEKYNGVFPWRKSS